MNVEKARFNMVEQQIRPWEVLDQDVLDVLFAIKRELFVPAAYQGLAFADIEVPLGHGANLLSPKVEARVLQALQVRKADRVLEIGTGSGFMAALLAARAHNVYSVELVPELAASARENLKKAGVDNVSVEQGDAVRGWASHAPYDVIMVSGSLPALPPELLQQLKVGGRLAAFVGTRPVMSAQLVTQLSPGSFQTVNLFETLVPPLANAPRAEGFVF